MKTNEFTALHGNNAVLIPYEKHHVEKYHAWMQDEELLSKTASEPLSLEEEYEMQAKWRNDADKCTFIILDQNGYKAGRDEVGCMVGDVNLFLNDQDDPRTAEVEVMIAERSMQARGLGKESVLLMMRYGVQHLELHKFTAKIGADNIISLSLFQKLGFRKCSEVNIFNELDLVFDASSSAWKSIGETLTTHIYPMQPPFGNQEPDTN